MRRKCEFAAVKSCQGIQRLQTAVLPPLTAKLSSVCKGRRPSGEKSSGTAAILCDLPCNRLKLDCF